MILIFAAVLAVLILSHEFGHFIFAKISGAKVEEFGLGFPPRLFGFKKGETLYSLNAIPFGGFVKIFGENSNEKKARSFASQPAYKRAMILAAGVFFNFVLAWLLFSVIFWTGAPSSVGSDAQNAHITILEVQKGTPAEGIGLRVGDRIQKLSFGADVLEANAVSEVQKFISQHKGREIMIDYSRGKQTFSSKVTPQANPPEGVGALGIAMDRIGIVSLPLHKAVWRALSDTFFLTIAVAKSLAVIAFDLVRGAGAGIQVMGPVGIAGLVGTASEFGFVYLVQLVALLSINLVIINLLPLPALDGGRLLMLVIETIKRSPISQRAVNIANSVGFAALIVLMILITYKDIVRIVHN